MSNQLWNLFAKANPESKEGDFETVTEWGADEITELRDKLQIAREALEEVQTLILCGKADQLPGRCDKAVKVSMEALAAIGDDK